MCLLFIFSVEFAAGPVMSVSNQPTSAVIETKIQLAISQPEIIVIENSMNLDSNAVALTVSSQVMLY